MSFKSLPSIWADDGQRFYLFSRDSNGPKKDWKVVLALFSDITQPQGGIGIEINGNALQIGNGNQEIIQYKNRRSVRRSRI